MKVTLIAHTTNPVDTLIFTKNTRLNMGVDLLENVIGMSEEAKKEQLEYMVNTIKSSWEFVDFTFCIEGVTRAFTHQFVRNRTGSYAQQTMRILNVEGFDYITGPSIKDNKELQEKYDSYMAAINEMYADLISNGAAIEDARGILPTNISTNITAKFNLRSLSQMMASRASSRTQGEYREVMDAMYNCVVEAFPEFAEFLRDSKTYACNRLESIIHDKFDGTEELIPYIKLIDQIRNA